MSKFAIITPTYIEHFRFIDKYLKSFVHFVEDKKDVDICFIISKSEEKLFQKIIAPYKNECSIKALFFEDILAYFDIKMSASDLIVKYKKFTFQTLKKFYAMLYVDADYFLVLDSETMWVNKTNMTEVFNNFIKAPFISGSSISNRKFISDFTQAVIDNVNFLLKQNIDMWLLENFVWFYDKNILFDLFNEYGFPFEMAELIYSLEDEQKNNSGIFEIELYQAFVYYNRDKYNYKFLDVDKKMIKTLPDKVLNNYINEYNKKFEGNCGLLEHTAMLLDEQNYCPLANIFKENNFNIIRCDYSNFENIELQEKFLKIVEPNILAASQEHAFGINSKYEALVNKNKYLTKLEKHLFRLLHPTKFSLQLLLEPFAVVCCAVKWFMRRQKNIKKYKRLYSDEK